MSELVPSDEVYLYPVNELISSEIAIASPELRGQRMEALNYWIKNNNGIVIAPISGVSRYLPPKMIWEKSQVSFTVGDDIPLDETLEYIRSLWGMNGYQWYRHPANLAFVAELSIFIH